MTWRLQAELPLRPEYTPQELTQFELTGQIIVVRDIKIRAQARDWDVLGEQSLAAVKSQWLHRVAETKRNTFPMCARWLPSSPSCAQQPGLKTKAF